MHVPLTSVQWLTYTYDTVTHVYIYLACTPGDLENMLEWENDYNSVHSVCAGSRICFKQLWLLHTTLVTVRFWIKRVLGHLFYNFKSPAQM